MGYFYILGTVLFTVYGQLVIKWRISGYGALPDPTSQKVVFLFKVLFDPFIFSGFVAGFIASFFWMAAMTRFEVSFAYPIILSGLLVITSTLGIVLLGESMQWNKLLGITLIASGVLVMFYFSR